MTDCEGYELEIEMHAHGALDASRVAALEAHLAQCPSCRRYQALMRRTESTMTAQSLDVNAMESRILALHDFRRARSWFALGVPVAMGIAVGLLSGHPWLVLALIVPVALLTSGAIRLRLVLEAKETARLGRGREEYLAHYRKVIDRQIRRIQVMTVMVPLFGAIALGEATLWHLWPHSMQRGAVFAVIGFTLLAAYVQVLRMRFRKLPALRKEREDLGA